jgi:S-adenosylmethionine synthetase
MEHPHVPHNYIFTSESVSEGHPDKVCDRISDAVLDAFLAEEPEARVACETFATTNRVVIGGEVGLTRSGQAEELHGPHRRDRARLHQGHRLRAGQVPLEHLRRRLNFLHEQSAHIAQGVTAAEQGRRRGRPGHHVRLRRGTRRRTDAGADPVCPRDPAPPRRGAQIGAEPTLGPDAKSQLSVRYEGGKPVEVTSIVLSTQHLDETRPAPTIRAVVEPYIREVLPEGWITEDTNGG